MATVKKQSSPVKGRVLVDGAWGHINQVIDISPEMVEQAEKSGQVDLSAEAVAYAESLKAE